MPTSLSHDESILLSASMIINYENPPPSSRNKAAIGHNTHEFLSDYDKYVLSQVKTKDALLNNRQASKHYKNVIFHPPPDGSQAQGNLIRFKRKTYNRSGKPSRSKSRARDYSEQKSREKQFDKGFGSREKKRSSTNIRPNRSNQNNTGLNFHKYGERDRVRTGLPAYRENVHGEYDFSPNSIMNALPAANEARHPPLSKSHNSLSGIQRNYDAYATVDSRFSNYITSDLLTTILVWVFMFGEFIFFNRMRICLERK